MIFYSSLNLFPTLVNKMDENEQLIKLEFKQSDETKVPDVIPCCSLMEPLADVKKINANRQIKRKTERCWTKTVACQKEAEVGESRISHICLRLMDSMKS